MWKQISVLCMDNKILNRVKEYLSVQLFEEFRGKGRWG